MLPDGTLCSWGKFVNMRSVKVALLVFEAVAEHQPAGVGELSRALGLPKTTVQRSLSTLAEAGWIQPTDHEWRRWEVAVKVLSIVQRTAARRGGLRDIALPIMEELRTITHETIHLVVRDKSEVVLIERLDSILSVRTFNPLGGRSALHGPSTGKSILAHLSNSEREDYLGQQLRQTTPATMVDPVEIDRELHVIRERGYAINLGEAQPDVHGVGAAIIDARGQPVAAISVSAPAGRMPEDRCMEYGPLVADAARKISRNLV